MKATLALFLILAIVLTLGWVIISEIGTSQPPVNHSPTASQNGKATFAEPGVALSADDFSKHYAQFNTNIAHKLNSQYGVSIVPGWECVNVRQILFGLDIKRSCHITCIMLSSATRGMEIPKNIWVNLSKSQFGIYA